MTAVNSRHSHSLCTTGSFRAQPLKYRVAGAAAAFGLFGAFVLGISSSTQPAGGAVIEGATRPQPPHIGDYCSSDPNYSKTTLKPLVDAPVASLLASKELKGQRKFEASDVLVKDGFYYAV
jgi:hypothetical protein